MGSWDTMGQAANVAQLAGVDTFGLVSMVVQAALAAGRHRVACRQLAQHVELVGSLLQELQVAELMRRPATRRPLEQLRAALRRCYVLVKSCQDCGYLHRLLMGAAMADELRRAQHEIDLYIRLIPLIALVDSNRVTAEQEVPCVVGNSSRNLHARLPGGVWESTEMGIQGHAKACDVQEQSLAVYDSGKVNLQQQKQMNMEEAVKLCTSTEERCPGFKKFDFSQIVDATDNFSERKKIGQGGFGIVYKGQLLSGLMVAIKRLDEHASMLEFKNEIQLAMLQHTNLVRLLGWCISRGEKILVYTLIQKDRTKGALLSWSKRLQVIKGTAEGLVYLHKHSKLCIVHRDLKPANILLDYDMNPKIADFGSASLLSSDEAEEHTTRVVGTSGYIAPEYACQGLYSVKTDVFSFGVLVLGIISGRRNTILDQQGDTVGNLVRHAWAKWKDGRLRDLVDGSLGDVYQITEITRCTQLALLCAQEDPADRPTMSDVVAMLNSESISLSDPKQPPKLSMEATNDEVSLTYASGSSNAVDITITTSAPISTRVRVILAREK